MARVSRARRGRPVITVPAIDAVTHGVTAPPIVQVAVEEVTTARAVGAIVAAAVVTDPAGTRQPPEPAIEPGTRAAPMADTLRGYVDEVNSERIKGWIWNPLEPQARIELEVLDGDVPLARIVANQFRSDLRDAGVGDGQHAFTVPLGDGLLPGARHVVHLRLAQTGEELPGSPIVVERAAPTQPGGAGFYEDTAPYLSARSAGQRVADPADQPAAGPAVAGLPVTEPFAADRAGTPAARRPVREIGGVSEITTALQSNIDSADWSGVKGWIWNPQQPLQRVELELLDGDTVLATAAASEYREDLEQAGIGDGRHGFSFSFTETLLPYARHVLHLRPVGSTVEVASFPRVLTREEAGVDPTVQFILGNIVADSDRAEKVEDLAPIITTLVRLLDGALARYFFIAEETAANAAELLSPEEFAPQFQNLLKSVQWIYPALHNDQEADPVVSIVIPVFNKFDLTYNCVKSVIEQGADIAFEIIVVDDCSRDETMLAGLAFGRGIRLIRNSENSGFIRSCNRGFDAARGEYVVFLNNDTEVRADWLNELYRTMQTDRQIGIAGAKLLYPDGTLQECGGIVWRLGDGWNWGRGQPADDPRFCYLRDADYVSGAALMIRRSLFAELGRFDEHYLPAYYEDTELCFRARQAGYRVVVQPASAVVHFEGASAGTSVGGTGMKRFQAINHRKFFERWKDVLATHRFNGELPELEVERHVRQRALFIDDSVPEPDKDAGSNAAFQHMLSLQRLGYKVSFVPADNMARIEPYTTHLQRRGIECLYHPFYSSVEDVFKKLRVPFELVYLHRYSNASKYAGMVRQHFPEARILYNVADLHFLRVERQAEVESDAKLREKAEHLRRLELGAMSFVDRVIVHSDAEAALLQRIAPDIEVQVVPWTIPLREIEKKAADGPRERTGIAFIGGYRHPPNIDAAKWAARSLMPPLRKAVPGIELLLVGSHMPTEVSSLATRDIVPLGYVPSLDSVFERVQLTIAPLRFGAGLKGKVLESMAAGIPCVMTTVAAEGIDLPAALQSLVADEPEALAQRIASLCRDDAEYRRVATAGKAHVAANYSPERIDALIREACGAT